MTNRKRVVQPVNPFANAEGNIPLSFPHRGEQAYTFGSLVKTDLTNTRNGLPMVKFNIVNPVNGKTIGVLAQCQIRTDVLKAYESLEEGGKPTIKFVKGNRARADFKTGMTTIVAENLVVEYPKAETAEVVPINIAVAFGAPVQESLQVM
jgi:hypothetical protein